MGNGDRPEYRWLAYEPRGDDDVVDAPVQDVHLRVNEYGGPFWYSEGCLALDFEEVHRLVGITRSLYDDIIAWHDEALVAGENDPAIYARQQDLLRRLADEVRDDIDVPVPRTSPPSQLSVLRTDPERLRALGVPAELLSRVEEWRSRAGDHARSNGSNDAAIWAWQDAGVVLAAEISKALGEGYVVGSD
ncbi:hypothetical protein [Nocardioides sp. SYSU DS0663]|uniref:hypothetical protein n=1 Tax=Nocardioides sp. SYSU DS0663 TaxID=3416445 RepID=UPI003F4B9394